MTFSGGFAGGRRLHGRRVQTHYGPYVVGSNSTAPERFAPPDVDANTLELGAFDEGSGATAEASVTPGNAATLINCAWAEQD